jgi:hypothetical protein
MSDAVEWATKIKTEGEREGGDRYATAPPVASEREAGESGRMDRKEGGREGPTAARFRKTGRLGGRLTDLPVSAAEFQQQQQQQSADRQKNRSKRGSERSWGHAPREAYITRIQVREAIREEQLKRPEAGWVLAPGRRGRPSDLASAWQRSQDRQDQKDDERYEREGRNKKTRGHWYPSSHQTRRERRRALSIERQKRSRSRKRTASPEERQERRGPKKDRPEVAGHWKWSYD